MVAGGTPTVQVLLDDGTGAFPYDITAYYRWPEGHNVTRGRADELADVQPGTCNIVLDNTDGRFTLGSTIIASPSPIRIDQRIRLKVAAGNLLTNPSIETNTAGWANSVNCSIARTTAQAFSGSASLQMTATAGGDMQSNFAGIAVSANATYTFSAYFRTAVTSRTCYAYVEWRDAGGFFISGGSASPSTDVTSGWTRISYTATAPANAVTATVGVGCFSAGAGEVHYVDAMMFQQASAVSTYAEGGALVTRYTGYISAAPVSFPSGDDGFSLVKVTLVDAQARAERWPMRSIVEQELLEDSPSPYYTMGEPSIATSAFDSSGNQSAALTSSGTGAAVVFGTAIGPGTDGLTAASFSAGKYLTTTALAGQTIPAVVCAFTTTATSTFIVNLIPGFDFISVDGSGHLLGPASLASAATVNDGNVHVAEVQYSGTTLSLLLDGAVVASTASGAAGVVVGQIQVGQGYTGSVAHLAFFSTNPGTTRGAAHATSMLTGFAGESGTARITRLANYANIPIGTLDTSLTNVPFVDITGASISACISDVTEAEMGLAYINGSGALDFHNRNRGPAKATPDITIDANFLDQGTEFQVDMQGVINYFETTAAGTSLTQVVRNTLSENGNGTATNPGHGRYPQSKTYLVQTDQEALDRANWIVNTHAEPQPRVGALVFDLLTMTAANQALFLAVEADTWIRVTGLPSQTPGGTTADLVVQGWSEQLSADLAGAKWILGLNVVARSFFTAWILDSTTYSVLDSTTKLFV